MQLPKEAEYLVYAQRFDRLTSRLEGLLGSWRFARSLGRQLVFFWPKPHDYADDDYQAASILDLKAMARDPGSRDLKIVGRRSGLRKDALDLSTQPGWPSALHRDALGKLQTDFFLRAKGNLRFRGESSAVVEDEKRELFKLLRPHPLILENLERAMAWIGAAPFMAVHIRRGDVMAHLTRTLEEQAALKDGTKAARLDKLLGIWIGHFARRTAPVELYVGAVRQADGVGALRGRVVVFSDDDEAAREFQRALPEGEVQLMADFPKALSEIQEAWLESLILLRASKIISTQSTFSLFASRYGNIPFVDVRPRSEQKKMRVFLHRYFEPCLRESPSLRKKCDRFLAACLRRQTLKYYGEKLLNFFSRG